MGDIGAKAGVCVCCAGQLAFPSPPISFQSSVNPPFNITHQENKHSHLDLSTSEPSSTRLYFKDFPASELMAKSDEAFGKIDYPESHPKMKKFFTIHGFWPSDTVEESYAPDKWTGSLLDAFLSLSPPLQLPSLRHRLKSTIDQRCAGQADSPRHGRSRKRKLTMADLASIQRSEPPRTSGNNLALCLFNHLDHLLIIYS